MKLMRYALGCVLMSGFAMANAGMLFDRGLPTDNLNNDAGANRSNVAWGTGNPYADLVWAMGDDFKLAGNGKYDVDTIRVWVVGGVDRPYNGALMSLYGGTSGGTISLLSTNYNATVATYADGSTYQGTSGSPIKMWQIDFDVDWTVNGNELQSFYLGGSEQGNTPFLHASNAALSGSTQQGADNLYRWGYMDAGMIVEDGFGTSLGNGWDKASDMNVQVFGSRSVPGPAAILPFLIGGVVALRRRRSK